MPTHQDETLQQRYARENQGYLKLCGSMTAEQVADLQLHLNNALAREQALQQLLDAADERADHLEAGIKWESDRNALLLASLTEAEDMLSVTSLEAGQRLTAAEQRNAELVALCAQSRTVIDQFLPNVGKCFGIDFALLNETLCDIERVINKPTESGESA